MIKTGAFLSYSFGLLTGLAALTNSSTAQTRPHDAAPRKVDLSQSFDSAAKSTFVRNPDHSFKTTHVAYFADSIPLEGRNWGTKTVITKRISDKEQVMILAEDKDYNRVIEQDEVTFMAHYKADDTLIAARTVLKNQDSQDYSVRNLWTRTKTGLLSAAGTRAFDYADYPHIATWQFDRNQVSRRSDHLLWPFMVRKMQKREPR